MASTSNQSNATEKTITKGDLIKVKRYTAAHFESSGNKETARIHLCVRNGSPMTLCGLNALEHIWSKRTKTTCEATASDTRVYSHCKRCQAIARTLPESELPAAEQPAEQPAGVPGWASRSLGHMFYVSYSEALTEREQSGATRVLGFNDACAMPMSRLIGQQHGMWWFATSDADYNAIGLRRSNPASVDAGTVDPADEQQQEQEDTTLDALQRACMAIVNSDHTDLRLLTSTRLRWLVEAASEALYENGCSISEVGTVAIDAACAAAGGKVRDTPKHTDGELVAIARRNRGW